MQKCTLYTRAQVHYVHSTRTVFITFTSYDGVVGYHDTRGGQVLVDILHLEMTSLQHVDVEEDSYLSRRSLQIRLVDDLHVRAAAVDDVDLLLVLPQVVQLDGRVQDIFQTLTILLIF